MSTEPECVFSYRAKRGRLDYKVTSDGEFVYYDYRSFYGRWRSKVPITELRPYAVRTIDHRDRQTKVILSTFFLFFGVIMAIGQQLPELHPWGIGLSVVCVAVLVHTLLTDPIEWANWASSKEEQAVYFFAGASREEFEQAIKDLEDLILARSSSCPC